MTIYHFENAFSIFFNLNIYFIDIHHYECTYSSESKCYLTDSSCEENWFEYGENCYFASKPNKAFTWTDALSECEEMSALLTSVADEDEHDFLVKR